MTEPTDTFVAEVQRLTDRYPVELKFFKDVFLWGGSTKGCYTRRFYETANINGLIIPKWMPLTTKGNYQRLYDALVNSLAEKHLDFENFCRSRGDKDRLAPEMWESAFWVGTMAGTRTPTHTIDIDLHDQIGWYSIPTRWHSSRTESVDGPYSYRDIPVVRPNPRFYQIAKIVHDSFPNRIWAFSSGSLGFAVWKLFSKPDLTHVVHRKVAARLMKVGLPWLEHYPLPVKSSAKLGKCHRRPCGADSGIITPSGVITDPIEQIRWFMQPQGTPSFDRIVFEHVNALMRSYRAFLSLGESVDHNRIARHDKVQLVQECWQVVEDVKKWLKEGCPIDPSIVWPEGQDTKETSSLCTHILNSTVVEAVEGEEEVEEKGSVLGNGLFPDSFWNADLPQIIESGQWLSFVKFVVENGFPVEDKFFDIISTLAKWFLFVEFYGCGEDQTIALLTTFVLTRHNGKVSRLSTGDHDVIEQIARIVKSVSDSSEKGASFFEDIRRKRATGRYAHTWNFAAEILRSSQDPNVSEIHTTSDITDVQNGELESGWTYIEDNTPLPDFVVEKIRTEFQRAGRQIRKRNGEFPVISAITRFFNYLLSGRKPGQRRCGRELLKKMGFNSRGLDRTAVINLLVKAGLVIRDGYSPRRKSTLWVLTDVDVYLEHRAERRTSSS